MARKRTGHHSATHIHFMVGILHYRASITDGATHARQYRSSRAHNRNCCHWIVNEHAMEGSERSGWRWPRSARQARIHATLAAIALWILVILNLTAGRGNRSLAGPMKGADFPYLYTVGSLARTHETAHLYDIGALHQAQEKLVPESESILFLPVYPPQTALLFEPFSIFWSRAALLVST